MTRCASGRMVCCVHSASMKIYQMPTFAMHAVCHSQTPVHVVGQRIALEHDSVDSAVNLSLSKRRH